MISIQKEPQVDHLNLNLQIAELNVHEGKNNDISIFLFGFCIRFS